MKYFFSLTFGLISSFLFAQTSKPWTKIDFGKTAIFDIVEVEGGFIAAISTNFIVNSTTPLTNGHLVKLDNDLNVVDTVNMPFPSSFHDLPHTLHAYGDSLYVYFRQTLPHPNRFTYGTIISYDHMLNKGTEYDLGTDSLIMNIELYPFDDTTFIFGGSNVVSMDSSFYIIQTDLRANHIKHIKLDLERHFGPAISISKVPATDQIMIAGVSRDIIYFNMTADTIDSIISLPYPIGNLSTFPNGHNYATNLVSLDFGSILKFNDFGEFSNAFSVDSTFVPENNAVLQPALLYGFDYEPVSSDVYTFNVHAYRYRPPGWRPGEDTSVAEVVIHKFNPNTHDITWKRRVQVYHRPGLPGFHPSPTTIRTTSDGGCIATFISHSEDSAFLPDPPAAFILKIGPNGELLAQTMFAPLDPQISIYPNPANEYLHINSHQLAVEITISDVSGRVVYQSPSRQQQHQVDVQEWPSGMYVVQMTGKDGKRWTEKVLVE